MTPLTVALDTVEGEQRIEGVVRLRFDAHDGARAVLPGHEPAVALVAPGAIEIITVDEQQQFCASDGGIAIIEPRQVRLVASWIVRGATLAALRVELTRRLDQVEADEARAVASARQLDVATRRALAALERRLVLA